MVFPFVPHWTNEKTLFPHQAVNGRSVTWGETVFLQVRAIPGLACELSATGGYGRWQMNGKHLEDGEWKALRGSDRFVVFLCP